MSEEPAMAEQAYHPTVPDGENATATSPISATGHAEHGRRYRIPARQGRAVRMAEGEVLTVFNPSGHQVCDFFALMADSAAEFLSMEHCRTALGRVTVREGDVLVTNRRRPLIEIIEDTSPGVHDILIACCDQPRYIELGAAGYHDNCADNFRMSLMAIGAPFGHVPSPFNIWMNIPVQPDGSYTWEAPTARAYDHIRLMAHWDCIAVLSACPQDMTPVNGVNGKPGHLEFQLAPA